MRALVCLYLGFVSTILGSATAQEETTQSGQVDHAVKRLVQLDLTVHGPEGAIADLGRDDFELTVDGRGIEEFFVDRICGAPQTESGEVDAVPASIPTTYLFYFDQPFLTMSGRSRALHLTRDLIPRLIKGNSRGMIVSNGRELTTFADLTEDVDTLLAAVDRIERDPAQWNPTTTIGSLRHVTSATERRGHYIRDRPDGARDLSTFLPDPSALVFDYGVLVSGELGDWASKKSWLRASMVLGRLIGVDMPKVMIYFADRGGVSVPARERFTADANAQGVRIYAIASERLAARMGPLNTPRLSDFNVVRLRANHESLATRTGGRIFLRGEEGPEIAKLVQDDLACFYMLSFDPAGFGEDRQLPVAVQVLRPKVKAQTRDSVILASEPARVTAQLLGAFAAPDMVESPVDVHGILIPLGYADGKYSMLAQIAVAGSPLAHATWDLGGSLISRGQVREDLARRVTVEAPHTGVVLESEIQIAPGAYELVMVARETNESQRSYGVIASGRLEGVLPAPGLGEPSVAPVAVVQQDRGVFVREDQVRYQGSHGHGHAAIVRASDPTALVTLVCRGKSKKPLRISRRLVGESAVDFIDAELGQGQEPCTQIRDVIPGNTLTDGWFLYEVRVLNEGQLVASATREFAATGPGEAR